MQMELETGIIQPELLQVADAVAREKGIERETVLEAMEQAIGHAGKRKYGQEHDIRAEIDRETGNIRLMRFLEVVDEVEDPLTQISLAGTRISVASALAGCVMSRAVSPTCPLYSNSMILG